MSFDTKPGPRATSPATADLSESQVPPREPDGQPRDDESPLFELFKPRPDDPRNIRNLRLVVIGMGVVLVVLFMAVIARIAYMMMRDTPGSVVQRDAVPVSAAASTLVPVGSARLAPDIKVLLPPTSRVKGHTLSGNRLAVHYEAPSGDGIMIVDLETGQALSHIRLPQSPN